MANERRTARDLYKKVDEKSRTLAQFGRNLNLCYLDRKLDPCHHRDDILETVQKTLLRKSKPNVLLTGVAGCGKTAIAEGLAAALTQRRLTYLGACEKAIRAHRERLVQWEQAGSVGESPAYQSPPKPPLCDSVVYEVSLNSMVGGTKYRGEFEQRLQDVIDECKRDPDIILFIDEFHCVLNAGATAEDNSGAAQILKPALARGEVRVIGATTTEEKAALLKDKAFARRFCELEVHELQAEAALDTARSILKHYCGYHNVSTYVTADEILSQVRYHLPGTVFPDNYINVVDETLAGALFDGKSTVGRKEFYQTLSRLAGYVILNPEITGTARAS